MASSASANCSSAKWQNRSKDCEHYKNVVLNKVLPCFPTKVVQAEDFNFQSHVLQDCFAYPMIVQGYSEKFGIKVPSNDFTIHQVAELIGKDTPIRLMDVAEQTEISGFTISQYADYLQKNQEICASIEAGTADPNNALKILNLISMEFSETKLSEVVHAPKFVPQLDWEDITLTDRQLQQYRDEPQSPENNGKEGKISSKVQKYCLIGMGGSYTDFHIDFGGTSVWYHVVRGGKRFFLIPPTGENLETYQKWNRSTEQHGSFLGDLVGKDQCFYLDLKPQQTLLLPSAWIHAVYTPEDALVFGGNFIHLPGIQRQLACYKIEDNLKIKSKYRYPNFIPLHWKIMCLALRTLTEEENEDDDGEDEIDKDTACTGTRAWSDYRLKTWRYLLTQSSILQQLSSMADNLLIMLDAQASDVDYQESVQEVCRSMTGLTPAQVFQQLKVAIFEMMSSSDMKTEHAQRVPTILNYEKCLSSTLVFKFKLKSGNAAGTVSTLVSSAPTQAFNNEIVKKELGTLSKKVPPATKMESTEVDDVPNQHKTTGTRAKRIRKELLDELVDEHDGANEDEFDDVEEEEEDYEEEAKFAKVRYNAKSARGDDDDEFFDEDDQCVNGGKKRHRQAPKSKPLGKEKKANSPYLYVSNPACGSVPIKDAPITAISSSTNKPSAKNSKPPASKRDQLKAILSKKWN